MSLFAGLLLGFLLALPPGGIVLVGLNLAMTSGYRRAAPYAYGAMLVDIFYALIAVMGAKAVMDFYARMMQEYPVLIIGMQLLLVCGLFCYGGYLLLRRTPIIERDAAGGFSLSTRLKGSGRTPFFLGLGLNFSNIFSPTFLIALAILASQAQAFGVLDGDTSDNILYAVGFGVGGAIYLQVGMKLVERYTARMQNHHVMRIQKIAGAAFAVIGGMLCFNVARAWMM